MYGSQRPRHEVQCPEFYVMKSVLSQSQLQTLLELNDDEIILSGDRLEEICTVLSKGFKPEEHGLDSATSWEMRCPSEGEWRHAHDQVELELEAKKTEILADGVSDNYRGAMMDGRPRPFTGIGPMAKHRTAIETHPNQKGVTALSSAPMDRELREMVARLVVTPVREDEEIRVPLLMLIFLRTFAGKYSGLFCLASFHLLRFLSQEAWGICDQWLGELVVWWLMCRFCDGCLLATP